MITPTPTPAGTAARWVPLLTLFTAATLIEALFWGQIAAFTPLYLKQLGLTDEAVKSWTGTISAVSALVGMALLPLWGALADRYARQPVIVRSFVAHLLAGVLAVLAGNVWVFLLARIVQSFALGNSGLMMTTLAERTPAARAGFAFSVFNGAGPFAAFLGPLLGGPIVDRWGFQALMGLDVVLLVGVVAAMAFGYHDLYHGTNRGPLWRMAGAGFSIIGRSPRLRVLFPAMFLLFSGWMLALTYLPLAVAQLYHGSDLGTAVGWVLGAGGFVTMVSSPLLGALADRLGHWRVLLGAAGVSVLLWPLPALAGDVVSFGVAWGVLNSVLSGVFALSFTVLSHSTPVAVRGRVMAFAYLPVNAGGFVGPLLGSLVVGVNLLAIFPLAAVLTALGIGAMLLARRQPAEEESDEEIGETEAAA
jgi:MFS family permease